MPEQLGDAILELRTDDLQFNRGITRARQGAVRLDTALDQAAAGAVGLGGRLNRAGAQATAAGGRFSRLGGRLGQVGFQVQDIAVQLGAGQSPFIVLAQQGSQIASAFGPVGIAIGTVVALAGTAAGVIFGLSRSTDELTGSLGESTVKLDEQIESLDDAIKKYRELTHEQRTLMGLNLTDTLQAQRVEQDLQEDQLDELITKYGQVGSALDSFAESPGAARLSELNNQFLVGTIGPVEYATGLAALRDEVGDTNQGFVEFSDKVRGATNKLIEQDLAIQQTLRRREALREIQKGNTKTTEEETDAIAKQTDALRERNAASIESLPALDETRSFGKPSGPGIQEFQKSLDAQNRKFGLGEHAPKLGEPDEAARSFRDLAESVRSTHGPFEGLIELFGRYSEAQNGIVKKQAEKNKEMEANFASTVGFISSSLQSLFGENKAFAIAEAIVSTALAVTKALSAAPPPYSFVLAGAVAALGAAQIATIAAQSFAQGGRFSGGIPMITGERGPELQIPEVGGRVFNARETSKMLAGGGRGSQLIVQNLNVAQGADPRAIAELDKSLRSLNASIESRSVVAVVAARSRDPNLWARRR